MDVDDERPGSEPFTTEEWAGHSDGDGADPDLDIDINAAAVGEAYSALGGCGVGGVASALGYALETVSFELLAKVRPI